MIPGNAVRVQAGAQEPREIIDFARFGLGFGWLLRLPSCPGSSLGSPGCARLAPWEQQVQVWQVHRGPRGDQAGRTSPGACAHVMVPLPWFWMCAGGPACCVVRDDVDLATAGSAHSVVAAGGSPSRWSSTGCCRTPRARPVPDDLDRLARRLVEREHREREGEVLIVRRDGEHADGPLGLADDTREDRRPLRVDLHLDEVRKGDVPPCWAGMWTCTVRWHRRRRSRFRGPRPGRQPVPSCTSRLAPRNRVRRCTERRQAPRRRPRSAGRAAPTASCPRRRRAPRRRAGPAPHRRTAPAPGHARPGPAVYDLQKGRG